MDKNLEDKHYDALQAASIGSIARLSRLLDDGLDLSERSPRTQGRALGVALGLVAAQGGHVEILSLLIERGVELAQGLSPPCRGPAWEAAAGGHLRCLEFLAARGADLRMAGPSGDTPLAMAASGGHLECVDFLAAQGAPLGTQNGHGRCAVFLAAQQGAFDVVQALARRGAPLDLPAKDGRTPAMAAAASGNPQLLALLLEAGANLSTLDKKGRSIIDFCHQNDCAALVRARLEKRDLGEVAGDPSASSRKPRM